MVHSQSLQMTEKTTLPAADRLLDLVDAMAGQPVLMLVDLVADRFISGTPKRISREAPVLILSYQGERMAPGGGANAVANVAALGGKPLLLGAVGNDQSGHDILMALGSQGIPTDGIILRAGYRTPTKVRIVGGSPHGIKQQIVRYDIEEHRELADDEKERFASRLKEWSTQGAPARVAVLSDYGYGAVQPSLTREIRSAVGETGTILCDSRYRLAEFSGLDGATPNEEEFRGLLGGESAELSLEHGGQDVRGRLGARFLLVTRGSRGMSLFVPGHAAHLPVSGTDQVADVTGAGDTVIGTFALALAAGAEPVEAAALSNYAAGIVVMKMGTATVSPAELRRAIRTEPRPLEELRWAPC
jgi:rfaE bifunctional protein kinase chain/domain